jgi:hypothetical protein
MRKSIVATLIAVAFGLMGVSFAQAAPGNGGLAIGKAASGLAPFEQAQWRRRRRRRRRRCFHRRRSRMRCVW